MDGVNLVAAVTVSFFIILKFLIIRSRNRHECICYGMTLLLEVDGDQLTSKCFMGTS